MVIANLPSGKCQGNDSLVKQAKFYKERTGSFFPPCDIGGANAWIFTEIANRSKFSGPRKKWRFYSFWLTLEGSNVIKGRKLGRGECHSSHKECADCWAMPVLELTFKVFWKCNRQIYYLSNGSTPRYKPSHVRNFLMYFLALTVESWAMGEMKNFVDTKEMKIQLLCFLS